MEPNSPCASEGFGLINGEEVQVNSAWLAILGVVLILCGGLLAWLVQTAGGIRLIDVRFVGSGGVPMSALLYIPPNATRATPAPGVLAVHGYFNSREVQDGFAIEFARRGYVVLALDQRGHGYSAPPAFAAGFGGPDGLRYLRSLDIVDKENIGLEGHSMGGWAVVNAAAAVPQGYRAMVLEGSSTGKPFASEGTPEFPRNIAVVFSRFDEFAGTMWGVPTAREVVSSRKLWQLFGTHEPIVPGKIYGAVAEGTARVLYTPGITHPMDHFSPEAIGYSLDWFQRTLQGGTARPASDQIWPWKELGTFVALIGFVVLLLGLSGVLLQLPYFAPLLATSVGYATRATRGDWVRLVAGAAIAPLTLLPLGQLADRLLPPSWLLPQTFTNEILVWAVLTSVALYALSLWGRPVRPRRNIRVTSAIVLAVLVVGGAYVSCAVADFLFKIDFRVWFVGVKLLSAGQARAFLAYLLPFTVFFVLTSRAAYANPLLRGGSALSQYLLSGVALAGGFLVFVIVEYGLLFSTDHLATWFPFDALRVILSIQFVPLLAIVALVTTFTFRRTQSELPGAFISALFVTWYIVAGQATQG
jgi:pimeloyl-ACP methyl ester carboxylesterase